MTDNLNTQQAAPVPQGAIDAIRTLLALARAAHNAMDGAEDLGNHTHIIHADGATAIIDALNDLDELPDDKPGYTMSGPAKAEWALRDLLAGAPTESATDA